MKNRDKRVLLSVVVLLALLLPVETLAQAAPLHQDNTSCETFHQDGVTLYHQARYSEALPMLQAALVCYREVGDDAREGVILNNIGLAYHEQGRYVEALAYYQQALTIHQEGGDRVEEGTTLNNIGGVYHYQGRYTEALESYQQALNIRLEMGDRAGEGLLLNNIGGVHYDQGRYAEALGNFWQALSITREVDDRAEEGDVLNNIGLVYDAQGRYAEALESYQQALSIRREVGDRAGEGLLLNNIGRVHYDQGRYAEALESYQQALSIQHEVGDRVGEGVILNNIGDLYLAQGHYTEALESYQQALNILREVGDRAKEGSILSAIGLVYHHQARYAEALEIHHQALAIHQEVKNRLMEGATLNNIGLVYHAQGRYAEALAQYQQALAIARQVGSRVGEGATLNNIGAVYDTQGRYAEALEAFQQSLVIRREISDRAEEGNTLNNIGMTYQTQGHYAEALESFQQALAIQREVGDRAREGTTLHNIGGMYREQGRYAEALEMFQQALTIRREVGNRAGEGVTLKNIGTVYRNQGHYTEALTAYQQAMDILETVRATAGSEQGRASFIARFADLYTQTTVLFYQQGQGEKAFFTSERGRARAFLDSLATGYVELTNDKAAALLTREQETYAARQAAQDMLAKARVLNPPDPDLVADLETQLTEAEQAYAEAQTAVEARGDQLADLVPGRGTQNILGVSGVQALLDEGTTLISYFVLKDQTLVFVITRSSFEVVTREVSREELGHRVRYFREVISHRQWEATQAAAQELYQLLITPLTDSLQTPRLVIVPHGSLHYLPFAALVDPDTEQSLLKRHSLVTLPSASALTFIQQNAEEQRVPDIPVLVLGNPVTADYDTTASLAVERAGLAPLPFAEREAEVIAESYGVEPLLGSKATEGVIWARGAEAGVLHLAAHGAYNPIAPLSSLIALAPDDTHDGWLTVGEVYGLDLSQTDLVVLSACQTNLGELSAGDELVGLTRAFFFAGTPTVVASLWNVDDEAAALLMERFHTHLHKGMSKAAALRQAQLEMMVDYPDPYFWAGFVLSGDGGEVSKSEMSALMLDSGEAEPGDEREARETPLSEMSPQMLDSDEAEPSDEGKAKETPVPSTEATLSRPSSWIWLIVVGGVLIIVFVIRVMWRRRARRHPS